jgi:hypothetical protein
MRIVLGGLVVTLALLAGSARAASDWPTVPAGEQLAQQRAALLAAAEEGVADTHRWWNEADGWYRDFLFPPPGADGQLARLWSVYPLLESLIALQVADPTDEHLARLRAVADAGAELYWNPSLEPAGGYEWYPNMGGYVSSAYYDDSGWWGLAYVDAYEATQDPKYLDVADRAFQFIVRSGWDAKKGGVWWETGHDHKTIEPLAAAVLVGTELYKVRRDPRYLQWVDKLTAWADAHSFNRARGLYQRNATDDTVMDYAQSPIIVADQELCTIAKRPKLCAKAKQLADASAVAFPADWFWAPQYDIVYLRWMLEYYRLAGDTRWYALALKDAQLALTSGRDHDNGLFTHGWDGRWIADGLEEDAANVELLAWTAATPPPG